jgi:hypothetical protein
MRRRVPSGSWVISARQNYDPGYVPTMNRLAACLMAFVVLGYAASTSLPADPGDGRPRSAGAFRATLEGFPPLGPAEQQTGRTEAESIMSSYRCPGLPDSGPASWQHVTKASKNAVGEVALELDNGLLFIYAPDSGTPTEYVSSVQDEISSGDWEGGLTALRRTSAATADANSLGSAVVSWLERNCLVELYGDGGQSLAELIPIAQSMPVLGAAPLPASARLPLRSQP